MHIGMNRYVIYHLASKKHHQGPRFKHSTSDLELITEIILVIYKVMLYETIVKSF